MQRRIGHVLDLEVVEVTSHQVRLELQRSEPQNRHRAEVTPFEIRPRLCRIDRCDIKQQIQAALDVGQTGIDIKSRRKLLGRGCHLTNALSSGSVGSVAVDVRIWCRRKKVVGVEADHRADTRWSYCEIHNHTGIVSCEQLTWLIWISDLVVIFHVTLLLSQAGSGRPPPPQSSLPIHASRLLSDS